MHVHPQSRALGVVRGDGLQHCAMFRDGATQRAFVDRRAHQPGPRGTTRQRRDQCGQHWIPRTSGDGAMEPEVRGKEAVDVWRRLRGSFTFGKRPLGCGQTISVDVHCGECRRLALKNAAYGQEWASSAGVVHIDDEGSRAPSAGLARDW